MTPNSALVTDACAAALIRRAYFSEAHREGWASIIRS
jgi:hypothetical protein